MKCWQIVFTERGKAALEEIPMPEIKPDEVLVGMEYTVLSAGTEKANLLAMSNTEQSFPKYMGYSGVGFITAAGSEVVGLKVGDRVLADHLGHKSHAAVKAEKVMKVENEKISSLDAAFVVIGSMGLQGVRKAKLELGESAMVMGLGILGMFAVQAARLSGGMPVIAVDFDEKRRALAKTLGADYTLSPADKDFTEKVQEYTRGRMINANIEVTGAFSALRQALDVAAWLGRITLTGCTRISESGIDYYSQVHKRGVSIIGAHNFVRPQQDSYPGYWTRWDDFRVLLDLIYSGRIKVDSIISEVVSPEKARIIYSRLGEDPNPPLGIVFEWRKINE